MWSVNKGRNRGSVGETEFLVSINLENSKKINEFFVQSPKNDHPLPVMQILIRTVLTLRPVERNDFFLYLGRQVIGSHVYLKALSRMPILAGSTRFAFRISRKAILALKFECGAQIWGYWLKTDSTSVWFKFSIGSRTKIWALNSSSTQLCKHLIAWKSDLDWLKTRLQYSHFISVVTKLLKYTNFLGLEFTSEGLMRTHLCSSEWLNWLKESNCLPVSSEKYVRKNFLELIILNNSASAHDEQLTLFRAQKSQSPEHSNWIKLSWKEPPSTL